jgi:NAD(P)-dependent dehydrogenase (short-subunit alcohol dehydrogenase family)
LPAGGRPFVFRENCEAARRCYSPNPPAEEGSDVRLEGKTAIVTGGARGIGAAIAQCFAEEGARVALLDLDLASAREHARALGRGALAFQADAASVASVAEAVDRAAAELGGLDVMVNNAGAGRGDEVAASEFQPVPPFTNLDEAGWHATLQNNLGTTFAGSKAAIPHLQARGGGSIVNIASIAALLPTPNLPAYGAAKAGVVHLTRTLGRELAPQGIRVNAICPGLVWTRSWERLAAVRRELSPELAGLSARDVFLAIVAQQVPMGVEQTPEQIGRLAVFLASGDAATITGQAISVDGGITLGPPVA